MKRVKTLNANTLKDTMKKGGCGECQTSWQPELRECKPLTCTECDWYRILIGQSPCGPPDYGGFLMCVSVVGTLRKERVYL